MCKVSTFVTGVCVGMVAGALVECDGHSPAEDEKNRCRQSHAADG